MLTLYADTYLSAGGVVYLSADLVLVLGCWPCKLALYAKRWCGDAGRLQTARATGAGMVVWRTVGCAAR